MKIFKKLNLNIITILLAILVTFSASVMIVLNLIEMNKKTKFPKNPVAYQIVSDISNDNYNNNTNFEIYSVTGLKYFSKAVSAGKDFSGKTVKLTGTINFASEAYSEEVDCLLNPIGSVSGELAKPFKGTFDGNNNTIKNFQLKCNNTIAPSSCNNFVNARTVGLFAYLADGAIVKNLHLDTFLIDVDPYYSNNTSYEYAIGAIAGCTAEKNNTTNSHITIQNCKITNGSVVIAKTGGNTYFSIGGIVGLRAGYEKLTIQNCEVNSFGANNGDSTSNITDRCRIAGIGPAYDDGYFKSMTDDTQTIYVTVENCVVKSIGKTTGYILEWSTYEMPGYKVYYSELTSKTLDNLLMDKFESLYSPIVATLVYSYHHWTQITNCYGREIYNKSTTLYKYDYSYSPKDLIPQKEDVNSFSALGTNLSNGGTSGSTWYYGGSNYNDGYPKLRQFISAWDTIQFGARLIEGNSSTIFTNSSMIPNPTSIQIPSDSNNQGVASRNVITFYLQTVTATPSDNVYEFTNWRKDNDYTWYAEYRWKEYTITFNKTTNINVLPYLNNTSSETISIKVRYGATIEYEREGNVVTYTVTDVNNSETVYTITYTFSGTTNDDYYIAEGNFGVSNGYEVTSDLTITPRATLKEYGSVWQ